MKKILAVSLVAVMAVSTARADIASTAYVTGAVGAEKSLRESADKAITDSIGTVSGTNMGTTASTVVTAIKEHSEALKSVASSGTVSTLSDRVTAIEESDYATSGVKAATVSQVATNTAAIAGMDLTQVGAEGDGKYIKTVKQVDGKVTATAEAADTTPTQNSKKMVTSGGVYTALAGKQGNLSTEQMAAVNSGITSAKVTTYDGYNAKITAAQNTADAKEASANKISAIKDGMTPEEKQVAFPTVSLVETLIDTNTADMEDQVEANKDAIAAMDLTQVGAEGDGKYIKTVKQVDGKVTATAEAADTTPTQNSKKMVTSGGVYTALSGKQATISDLTTIRSGAAAGATAVQKVESGSSNGTIKVDNTDVSVTGLKSAAYTESSAYATAAQGTKIDNITSATILELGAATGVDGNYVLTMKKEGSTITYKWEAIDRAY